MKQLKIIISGGGTGGHIFPALAIANALKERHPDAEILFIGAQNRMEMTRVPKAGYKIIGLPVTGFNRKHLLKNIPVIWKLLKSMLLTQRIIRQFKPDIVIGVGGYASGPILRMASSKGIPTLIQEQNSYAGVTNKILAKKAAKICVAYTGMERFFPASKIVLTGNPCRQHLDAKSPKEEAYDFFQLDRTKKTLLIIGGSLGSRTINDSILNNLNSIDSDIQILWQTGELYSYEIFVTLESRNRPENIHIQAFIDRMELAYQVADLVISRAGASSISELSLLSKPVILIPSPNVSEDHQTKNAMALVEKDAAILVKDSDSEKTLVEIAMKTIKNRLLLQTLAKNISKLAQHNSANRIVDEIEKLIKKEEIH